MTKAKFGLKIAIAGLGVVGSEVARQLINRNEDLAAAAGQSLDIVAVSARDRSADRAFSLGNIDWHDDAAQLATRDDVDIIVEMLGGSEGVALDLARASLSS